MKKKIIILAGVGLTGLIAAMIYGASKISAVLENDIFDIEDEDF